MVTIDMMQCLQKELEELFKTFEFEVPGKKLNIYLQNEPREIGATEDDEVEPYQVIKAPGGIIELDYEAKADKEDLDNIVILMVCPDRSNEQVAWIDILNQVQRIGLRFARNPIFGNKYIVKKISWMLADENPYPLNLGGVEMKIETKGVVMEATEYD